MNIKFYDENADNFFDDTAHIDMSDLHGKFCLLLPDKGKLLDLGCGSGRDVKAFIERGYDVIGLDGSFKLVQRAREFTKAEIIHDDFENLSFKNQFDGIWACASLLHVERKKIPQVLNLIKKALKKDGVLYMSFKEGNGDRAKNKRTFTDMTIELLEPIISNSGMVLVDAWTTDDVRPNKKESWLNVFVRK